MIDMPQVVAKGSAVCIQARILVTVVRDIYGILAGKISNGMLLAGVHGTQMLNR